VGQLGKVLVSSFSLLFVGYDYQLGKLRRPPLAAEKPPKSFSTQNY
jgi:hypothetical protein